MQSHSFFVTGGSLRPDAPSYVERRADQELFEALTQGEFCYVLTSRQMGKSSLLVRTAHRLRAEGMRVVVLDLTALGRNLSAEQWYYSLLIRLGEQVGLEGELREFWLANPLLGPLRRLMAALEHVVLPRIRDRMGEWKNGGVGEPHAHSAMPRHPLRGYPAHSSATNGTHLVVLIDEIDSVRGLPFSTDEFFAAVRECYNRRSEDPLFQRLTFCLSGVASPADLIRDTRSTPFNIGRRIELTDFTPEECQPLARGLIRRPDVDDPGDKPGLGDPGEARSRAVLKRVLHWTGGHPYLTQRLCAAVATAESAAQLPSTPPSLLVDRLAEERFLSHAARERDDNLIFVRERLLRGEADLAALLELYARVWRGQPVSYDETNPLCTLLRLSGVVELRNDPGERNRKSTIRDSRSGALRVRNRIYARVFDAEWITAHMPDAELRRQQAAYRRGLLRATCLAGGIAAVMLALASTATIEAGAARRAQARESRLSTHLRTALAERDRSLTELRAALTERDRQARIARTEARRADDKAREAEWNAGRATNNAAEARLNAAAARHNAAAARRFASDAERARRVAEERLVQMSAARGMALANEGDLTGALPWLAEALRLERDPAGARLHRDRLAAVLAQCPALIHAWFPEERVTVTAVSPSGDRLLTADATGALRLRDLATGTAKLLPIKHPGPIAAAAISVDGRRVVTAGREGARVWSAADGSPLTPLLKHGKPVLCACFSDDGRRVATGGEDRTARVWDAATGAAIGRPLRHAAEVTVVSLDAGGTRLLTVAGAGEAGGPNPSTAAAATEWEVATGKGTRLDHPGVTQAAFSRDGDRMATSGRDGTARVWDARGGKPLSVLYGHQGPLHELRFSADGRSVVTAGEDHTARLWDAASGGLSAPPLRHPEPVRAACFSRDGRRVITAVESGVTRVWEPRDGASVLMLHTQNAAQTEFSPDGRRVATASGDQTARIWDAWTGRPLTPPLQHPAGVHYARFTPDGARLVTVDMGGGLRLWSSSGRLLASVKAHTQAIWHAAISRDGRKVATAGLDKIARVWDTATLQPVGPPLRHDGGVLMVVFSSDGERLLTSSQDGTARLWDSSSGEALLAPMRHSAGVFRAIYSPDEKRVLTTSMDRTARLWDAGTAKPLTPPLAHQAAVEGSAFSPDGLRVVTASHDGVVRIWDARSGSPLSAPMRHHAGVSRAAFSPDGRWMATASDDRTARLWDVATAEPLGPPLRHGGPVYSVSFSRDGRRVLTGSADGTARIWRVAPERGTSAELLLFSQVAGGGRLDPSTSSVVAPTVGAQRRLAQRVISNRPEYVRTSPGRAMLEELQQATACEKASDWAGAIPHLTALVDADPEAKYYVERRAYAYYGLGRWKELAADCERIVELAPEDWQRKYWLALALCRAGETERYRKLCSRVIAEYRRSADLEPAHFAAWICAVGGGLPDPAALPPLLERATQYGRLDPPLIEGALLYRAGRYREAIPPLEKVVQTMEHDRWKPGYDAVPRSLLAMSYYRAGDADAARQCLERGKASQAKALKTPGLNRGPLYWDWWLRNELLEREAVGVLAAPPGPQPAR